MLTVFFSLLHEITFLGFLFFQSCRDGENGYVSYYRVYHDLSLPVGAKICNLATILN